MIYHLYSQRCFPLNLGDLSVNTFAVGSCCRQSTQPVEEVNSLFHVQSQKRLICDDPVWFGALVRADVL